MTDPHSEPPWTEPWTGPWTEPWTGPVTASTSTVDYFSQESSTSVQSTPSTTYKAPPVTGNACNNPFPSGYREFSKMLLVYNVSR